MEITNLEQANEALGKIGDKKRAIAVVKSRFQARLSEVNKQMDREISDDKEDLENMERQLIGYMEGNPGIFEKKKTIELAFGKLQSRKSPARLELDRSENWDIVLAYLQKFKMNKFIEIKRSPDKAAIKKGMSSVDMEKIGVKKVQDIRFEYKTI